MLNSYPEKRLESVEPPGYSEVVNKTETAE